MKLKNFYILILFIFAVLLPFSGYASDNTQEYCNRLFKSFREEYHNKNYTKSLQILTEIKTIASNNNWTGFHSQALNGMGVIYTEILDYENAINCFLEAYKISLRGSNEIEEMAILNNISELYFINEEINKAKEYVSKAYEVAQKLQDSLMMGKIAINLGVIANETGNFTQAEEYLDIAISILRNYPKDILFLINAKQEKAKNLYLKKRYHEAEYLSLEVLSQIPEIQNDNNIKSRLLLLLSKIYQQKDEIQQAIHSAKESLSKTSELPLLIDIYEQLSDLYQENYSPYLALQYKDSVIFAKDSLSKMNRMYQVMNNQIKFDLINSEKKLAEKNEKQKAERILFTSGIIIIFLVACMLIWMFIKNKQRKKIELEKEKSEKLLLLQQLKEQEMSALWEQERLQNEKNEKLLLKQLLKEQETLAFLEQERLNSEIEIKNKQLAAKVLFQSNKSELMEDVINILSGISGQLTDESLKPIIQQLKSQIKESKEWDNFLVHFEKINPDFLSSLKQKHPNLTSNDIRLLSYLYLNLNTKEVASLLNITIDYCKKRKQRLAKKMGVSTFELYNYLINLK